MKTSLTISKTKIDKLFSISIILLPFLYQYKGIGNFLSFGEILVIITTILALMSDNFKVKNIDKPLLIFYLVSVILSLCCMLFSYFSINDLITTLCRLVLYGFVINLARSHFDFEYVYDLYVKLTFIFSVYLILQYLYNLVTGGYLPIYINYSWQFPPEARPQDLAFGYRFNFRPSSLFLEPSYFAFFVLPCVTVLFLKIKKSMFEYISIFVCCVALILSTASSGIVGLGVITIILVLKRPSKNNYILSFFKIVIVLVVVMICLDVMMSSEYGTFILNRISSGGSFNQRVLRGLIVYGDLDVFHKLFGVGINNLEPYMLHNGLYTIYDEQNLNYSASFVQTLNYSGLIGFLALLIYLLNTFRKMIRLYNLKKGQHDIKFDATVLIALFVILIYVMSYESILFTYRYTFLIIIYEAIYRSIKNIKLKENGQ